jgi:hypothetical protein
MPKVAEITCEQQGGILAIETPAGFIALAHDLKFVTLQIHILQVQCQHLSNSRPTAMQQSN